MGLFALITKKTISDAMTDIGNVLKPKESSSIKEFLENNKKIRKFIQFRNCVGSRVDFFPALSKIRD